MVSRFPRFPDRDHQPWEGPLGPRTAEAPPQNDQNDAALLKKILPGAVTVTGGRCSSVLSKPQLGSRTPRGPVVDCHDTTGLGLCVIGGAAKQAQTLLNRRDEELARFKQLVEGALRLFGRCSQAWLTAPRAGGPLQPPFPHVGHTCTTVLLSTGTPGGIACGCLVRSAWV